MVNYYIYAKDFSGSTRGCQYYHNNGLKTLEQFKNDVEKIKQELLHAGEPQIESKIIYLHWGHECYEVSEETTIETYKQLNGDMCTYPKTIIEWIQQNYDICNENNKIKLLYILTDGEINVSDADKCFELNENMQYETVVFHAFNEDLDQIDLSVAASFFKSQCIVYRNYELFNSIDISEEFDYEKITIDNFETEKDNLKSYIQLKFIRKLKCNTLALQEVDKLKNLRNRLFKEMTSKSQTSVVNLETKDRNIFLREFTRTPWYISLNGLDWDARTGIEKSISTLINYIISDTKSFAFDALKFNTEFKNRVEEEPIEVDVDFNDEQEIEFPDIILDDDKGIPVVILTEFNLLDKIIFHTTEDSAQVSSASFSKFKSMMECPLFLMNDPDVSESIGYFYTLNDYKNLLEKTMKTEPRTRRPFHGGLVLTDTDLFDKYNDYVLSATYFDSKKVNFNIGLFYFVLWKNCEKKEWMDKNVVERFKQYVLRRISATVCKIGLSSLPLDPRINVSLPTALWYCVELSTCIFKDDSQNYMQERLRMMYGIASWMIEILKYFSYDLDLVSIKKRIELIRHINILKRIPTHRDKVYYLLERIFKNVNGFLTSEIERPFNVKILNYLKLNHQDMLWDDVIEEEVDLNDYIHLMHYELSKSKADGGTLQICTKTFRPFFVIEKNKSFYTELVNATRKIVISHANDKDRINITHEALDSLEFDKILSPFNLFINCVKDSGKYPTLPEYIEYIHTKKKFNCDLVTIFPPNVYIKCEDAYLRYQNIVINVDVNEFIKVCKKYVNRIDRIKAENVVQFENDNEISEFISSEELKVNLKKEDRDKVKKPRKIKESGPTQPATSRRIRLRKSKYIRKKKC